MRAGFGCDARGADDELQRMDVAGAGVAHAAEIVRRAEARGGLLGVHEGDMRIAGALAHVVGISAVVVDIALLVRDGELARHEVDLDAVRRGEFEKMRLGLLGEVEQRLGAAPADLGLELVERAALAGAELAAIPARCAVAEAMRLDQRDIGARLGEMGRRRQAGEAAADDDDVGAAIAVERA